MADEDRTTYKVCFGTELGERRLEPNRCLSTEFPMRFAGSDAGNPHKFCQGMDHRFCGSSKYQSKTDHIHAPLETPSPGMTRGLVFLSGSAL